LQLCLSIEKSLRRVLKHFVIQSDYSEIHWKCKGTELLMYYRRNRYKIALFMLSISLSACFVFYPLHSNSEPFIWLLGYNNFFKIDMYFETEGVFI